MEINRIYMIYLGYVKQQYFHLNNESTTANFFLDETSLHFG